MNINCMIVHREYYTNPFQTRYQISKGYPHQVYEIWEDFDGIEWRKVDRMTGVQAFCYPEFLENFVEEEVNENGEVIE